VMFPARIIAPTTNSMRACRRCPTKGQSGASPGRRPYHSTRSEVRGVLLGADVAWRRVTDRFEDTDDPREGVWSWVGSLLSRPPQPVVLVR
jgi:hypothetical protein